MLTVRQPWADLSLDGARWEGGKHVENRTWPVPRWAFVCPDCAGSGGNARASEAALAFVPCPTCDGTDIRETDPGCVWPFRVWIHSSRRPEPASHPAWTSWAMLAGGDERGAILGARTVIGCHHADACREHRGQFDQVVPEVVERIDYCTEWSDPDAWHWVYDPDPASIIILDQPIPLRGRLGLWTPPDDIVADLRRQEAA